MKTIDNDDAGPGFAYGAAINAQLMHKKYWPTYSVAKQQLAQKLEALVYGAYGLTGSKVYLNAREGFIAVKVDKPASKTFWQCANELAAVDAFVKQHKVEEVLTKQNLVFRIPR